MNPPSTDGGIAQAEARLDLARACEFCTPRQRAALSLWLRGYGQDEIAERVNSEQSAISRLLARAILTIQANY